jgi:hypothetical protein
MSNDAPQRPSQPSRPAWRQRLLGRDALLLAGSGIAAGLVGGFGGFWIASSRGLDRLSVAETTTALALLVAGMLFVLGLARIAWFDDPRVFVLFVVLFAGSWIGDRAAFMSLPGNTTDGTLQLALAGAPVNEHATCTWDGRRNLVTSVHSRRNLVAAPHAHASVRLEMPAEGTANLQLTGLAPVSFEPVSRYSAALAERPAGETGRLGQLVAAQPTVERLPAEGVDPALAEFVRQSLREGGAEDRIDFSWECPQLP